jgi:hypothetical protein
MKVIRIFVEIDRSILSVQFENAPQSAYALLFNQWNDVAELYAFFEMHQADLQSGFFGAITIEEAVQRTLKEAGKLEQLLLKTARAGQEDRNNTLQTLFKPLHNQEYQVKLHQKSKLPGSLRKSWLRIYAIRIAPNLFVVTGGAIKLTATMQGRTHLAQELSKLEAAKNYLVVMGLLDETDFDYLEIT